jgi:hypothetical protein
MKKVVIDIIDGVVSIQERSGGVEVEIRDFDVPPDWDESRIGCSVDEDGQTYQSVVFPVKEEIE